MTGRWKCLSPSQLNGIGFDGKTLVILGMGDIVRRVADRALSFGMEIAYHNRHQLEPEAGRYLDDPRRLVGDSDVLLLAWPSRPETRRFLAAKTLPLDKPNMILVHIGRGRSEERRVGEECVSTCRSRGSS